MYLKTIRRNNNAALPRRAALEMSLNTALLVLFNFLITQFDDD